MLLVLASTSAPMVGAQELPTGWKVRSPSSSVQDEPVVVRGSVDADKPQPVSIDLADKLTAKYTDADGVEHTICTVFKVGESISGWVTRHKLAVEAMKEAFPPALPGGSSGG